MKSLKGLTLVVATVLVVATHASAGAPTTVSSMYDVGSSTVPGVTTALVLDARKPVTVTATGTVCFAFPSLCYGPGGNPAWDTTVSGYGGFVLPGAPAWGLVGRVGSGPWVQIGTGPTTLSGIGEVVFAVNDDLFSDNQGSFTVTVSYACWPGWGYGDKNHSHCGPPGLAKEPATTSSPCRPGWGNGDTNHSHCGPPGLAGEPAATQTAAQGRADKQDAPSSGPGKSEPQGEAKGHSKK